MKKRTTLRAAAWAAALLLAAAPSAGAAGSGKMYGYADSATGLTFVPIRFFSERSGASVDWNSERKRVSITKKDVSVTLNVGSRTAEVNGEQAELAAAPFTDGGVTYVPLRFITDALRLNAEWDSSLASVKLQLTDGEVTLPVIDRGARPEEEAAFSRETRSFRIGSRTIEAELLAVSLLAPGVDLSVALAGGKAGETEELKNIAARTGATAAMNGTFFDAYTDAAKKNPYGYIVSDGQIAWRAAGDKRTIFVFDKSNNVEFVDGADFLERFDRGDVEGALQAGPRLLRDGKVALNVVAEGFKDPKILTGGGARSAIGVTRDHRLLLATVPGATIPQLAEMMKQAGAVQAMNLDGGASSGLYYNGRYVTKPGRPISNALVIKGM
ncbi:phosphodiester glycosidase family protein [Cohnella zeiphila]|uniref:Phosphodiester glycosidase family protein n=1 Tax=Cohnella zeiphila TaxID=2761120 RepID=A0A7X0VZW5_9BACL|nr:phosphodiester glycosidase family protein [Cohnella zeiphila]MBB6735982.1 phosphodiester glycosidase family protein [Cohnella zeiphila]